MNVGPDDAELRRPLKIGRNDPCHCGSGKKYKRCHLTLDKENKSAACESQADLEASSAEAAPPSIERFLQELPQNVPQKDRAELDRILQQSKSLITYMQRSKEIESAAASLEAHRAQFDKLTEDQAAYFERVQSLFAEERFAPLWFTAADVQRAFENVGYVPNFASDEQMAKIVGAAILHLAEKDLRQQLSMELLLHLPHYVSAGRHLDGCVIQHCAYATSEFTDESNPFLFELFSHGYDAWVRKQDERDESLLEELGMTPARLRSMSLEEIDAWVEELQADPATKARLEALMAKPDRRSRAVAGLETMERDSVELLEREDARSLLLPQEEIEEWASELAQSWEKALDPHSDPSNKALSDDQTAGGAFDEAVRPLIKEMTETIFTPERINELVIQLKKYRNERFENGDQRAAFRAMGAIISLEGENDPSLNYFLWAVCFVSLHAFFKGAANKGPSGQ